MKRREILRSGGGALAALLGGVAVVSAVPTAASDREKVEAIENYLALNHKAQTLGRRASDIAHPRADRARERALAEGEAKGLEGGDLEAYAHEKWVEVFERAYAPYRAEVDAAWEASHQARMTAARLFGQDDIF